MSDIYHDFIERLRELHTENGGSLEISVVKEADTPELMLEVHAVCHDDPVLRPEDDDGIGPEATGPWNRRSVTLVVTLPCDTGDSATAELRYSTADADDAGNRLASFHWVFDETGEPGLAEMSFSDSKTFKLDYFSVLPPDYVRTFVSECEQAYEDTL